jgi:aryl-alcohol dehydrogenase-like predicted oxidoreductase
MTTCTSPAGASGTFARFALAWLVHRSPVMLPIPGTSSLEHLDQNIGAAFIHLTNEQPGPTDERHEREDDAHRT